VHGAGGTLLQHLKELVLHTDLGPEDRIFYFTTCGWMMWNWLVSSLAVGATVVLYDGAPLKPEPTILMDMAAAEKIVHNLLERATAVDGVPEQVTEGLAEELASSLACHAAITINHELALEEQRALLRDLAATENPYRCPHGRPIVLRLSHEEMVRRLGRR
jgi:acyl-coenzyme A synthetase/AMP-(fatty) acid ligase